METEVYNCSVCHQPVPEHEPRFHCMSCNDYNLCASCRRNAKFSGGHMVDHIYQRIQTGVLVPNGFPLVGGGARPQYTGEPHPFWGRMTIENGTALDRFRRLIDSIHNFMSRAYEPRGGDLEPEKARCIMDLLKYPREDNIFTLFHDVSTRHPRGLAWSDLQTLLIYRRCGWEYQEGTRNHEQQVRSVPEGYRGMFSPAKQGMPLLTRTGLREMLVMEALADPQVFGQRFNILLRTINSSQSALIDLVDGSRFPTEPIQQNFWPIYPDTEAVWTRTMMREAARAATAAVGTGRCPYWHM